MNVIQFVEYEIETDFALLYAAQASTPEPPTTMAFAASAPGAVAMTCGTKYANLHVRLERWDEHPPAPTDDWEDIDEVPWVTISAGGTVTAAGFDPAKDDDGLVVDDLPRARVQVLAKGRHRYEYGDGDTEHRAPEQWLLRWWSDSQSRDALGGPPRRIAGASSFWYRRTGWQAAFHAWRQTGWHDAFSAVTGFREIESALSRAQPPLTADRLPELWGPWGGPREASGAYTWGTSVFGPPPARLIPTQREREQQRVEAIATAARMPAISTFSDALTAMQRLGLLFSDDEGRLAPNPAPTPAWEVLRLEPQQAHMFRLSALYADYQVHQGDLEHVIRWAPDGVLATTPLAIATRLSLSVESVIGALQLLSHLGSVSINFPIDQVRPETEIAVTKHRNF